MTTTRRVSTKPASERTAASETAPDEQIRQRAYGIYEMRCREGMPGDAVSDWLRAEQELRPGVARR
jgi:hypothetical protein